MNTTANIILVGFRIALIIFNFILFNLWDKVSGDAAVLTLTGIVAISILLIIPWSQIFIIESNQRSR